MDEENLHKAFTDSKPVDIQLNVHNCRNSNIYIYFIAAFQFQWEIK